VPSFQAQRRMQRRYLPSLPFRVVSLRKEKPLEP
jgi:hypothetical protein